jgi:hypothetical protein
MRNTCSAANRMSDAEFALWYCLFTWSEVLIICLLYIFWLLLLSLVFSLKINEMLRTSGIQKRKIYVHVIVHSLIIQLLPEDSFSHRPVTCKVMRGIFQSGSLADCTGQLIRSQRMKAYNCIYVQPLVPPKILYVCQHDVLVLYAVFRINACWLLKSSRMLHSVDWYFRCCLSKFEEEFDANPMLLHIILAVRYDRKIALTGRQKNAPK